MSVVSETVYSITISWLWKIFYVSRLYSDGSRHRPYRADHRMSMQCICTCRSKIPLRPSDHQSSTFITRRVKIGLHFVWGYKKERIFYNTTTYSGDWSSGPTDCAPEWPTWAHVSLALL